MRRLLPFLLSFGLALSCSAWAQVRGGELRYGRYADSLFLDPVLNDANLDIWILTNLYDTLLQPTEDGKGVQPGLATEVTPSGDGLSYVVKLRPNIKFADGSPITPEDVKWSLDRARNPENGIWNFLLTSIESIDTGGDEVTINLARPDASLPAALATFNTGIMSKTLFEAAPGATDAEKAEAFAEKPVGSGPFMVSEWQRGSSMVLERNPYYWEMGADGKPLPYLDRVHFDIITDDNTRILRLQAGEIQGAEFIPLSRVAELSADSRLNMELFPSTQVNFVIMNNRPELNDGSTNPLSDLRVRQALNYATDKDALIQVVAFGNGSPMKSFMSSTTPLYDGSHEGYPADLEKAKSLLAEAGYQNGFSVSILTTTGSANDLALATALQNMWGALGVKINIEQLESATETERYRNADFDMRVGGWTNDISDPSEITSYFAVYANNESLYSGFQNDEIDTLFAQSQEELDVDKRAEEYRQIQKIYMDAAPIVFLYETPYPVALQTSVKGFVQIPLGNNIFKGAYLEQ